MKKINLKEITAHAKEIGICSCWYLQRKYCITFEKACEILEKISKGSEKHYSEQYLVRIIFK